MKKDIKNLKKRLVLDRSTIKKLDEKDLENVVGGTSCLPPPPARS